MILIKEMEKPEQVKIKLRNHTISMKNNTNKLIERDSHLDDMESRSAQFLTFLNSNTFRKEARTLRRKQCINAYSCIMVGFDL